MDDKIKQKKINFSIWYMIAAILVMSLIRVFLIGSLFSGSEQITYSDFKTKLRAGEIQSVTISQDEISGITQAEELFTTIRVEDPELIYELEAHNIEITGKIVNDSAIGALLGWILPLALMFAFW